MDIRPAAKSHTCCIPNNNDVCSSYNSSQAGSGREHPLNETSQTSSISSYGIIFVEILDKRKRNLKSGTARLWFVWDGLSVSEALPTRGDALHPATRVRHNFSG